MGDVQALTIIVDRNTSIPVTRDLQRLASLSVHFEFCLAITWPKSCDRNHVISHFQTTTTAGRQWNQKPSNGNTFTMLTKRTTTLMTQSWQRESQQQGRLPVATLAKNRHRKLKVSFRC